MTVDTNPTTEGSVGHEPTVEELEAAQSAASNAATFKAPADDELVVLFDPEHESLTYGPGRQLEAGKLQQDVIQFGPKGFFEPGVWIGPANHPLLGDLLLAYPLIQVKEARPSYYLCPIDEQQFTSKLAFRAHSRVHKT